MISNPSHVDAHREFLKAAQRHRDKEAAKKRDDKEQEKKDAKRT